MERPESGLRIDAASRSGYRRYAYVLGLTHGWQADMGGLLHFLDNHDQITATVVPRFNSLTLFAVPARHLVSTVAPWVTTPRLAITGWLMVGV